MKIAIGCDHAGLDLKQSITDHLKAQGHEVTDCGTYTKESCHYPVIAEKVALEITQNGAQRGILVCGTGIGMSIAANKVRGIRAAAVSDCFTARATRQHNDSNIICIGERTVGTGLALMLIDEFVGTEFEGGRHQTRVDMITEIEKKY